jgi:hypothetical protein
MFMRRAGRRFEGVTIQPTHISPATLEYPSASSCFLYRKRPAKLKQDNQQDKKSGDNVNGL